MYNQREQDELQAKVELTQLQAMKVMITNNDIGAEINVGGLKVGVSMNERLLPVIEAEINEINLFLDGKPNNWE